MLTSLSHGFHKRRNSGDNGAESSLVSAANEKQDQDPFLLELKENFDKQRVLDFQNWEMV